MDIRCCPHNGHVEVTLPPLRRLCDVERDNSVPMLGAGQSVLLWAPSSCARVDTLYTVDHENRPRLAHQPLSFFAEADLVATRGLDRYGEWLPYAEQRRHAPVPPVGAGLAVARRRRRLSAMTPSGHARLALRQMSKPIIISRPVCLFSALALFAAMVLKSSVFITPSRHFCICVKSSKSR